MGKQGEVNENELPEGNSPMSHWRDNEKLVLIKSWKLGREYKLIFRQSCGMHKSRPLCANWLTTVQKR